MSSDAVLLAPVCPTLEFSELRNDPPDSQMSVVFFFFKLFHEKGVNSNWFLIENQAEENGLQKL